jgi:hypothetical protein
MKLKIGICLKHLKHSIGLTAQSKVCSAVLAAKSSAKIEFSEQFNSVKQH